MPSYPNTVSVNLDNKVGEHPSLRDWGAVCDGTTDDTVAWNNAIAAIVSEGEGYLFLPGTSAINHVDVPSNVHIWGRPGYSAIVHTGTYTSSYGLLNFTGTNASLDGVLIDGGVGTSVGVLYSTIAGNPYVPILYDKTSIWVRPGASGIRIHNCQIQHTGGFAILIDSDTANTDNIEVVDCHLLNNRPHLFGSNTGTLTYGAWTGGIWVRGDCRTAASKVFRCSNIKIHNNTFKRCNGNMFWMHSYGFDTHHINVNVIGNSFEDWATDAVEIGNCTGFNVSGNTLHRGGYTHHDDSSATVPTFGDTIAVGLDTSGFAEGGCYSNNTLISVNGEAFMDLDGMRKCTVKGNTCVIPDSTDPLYIEDAVASYGGTGGNLTRGIQSGNTSVNGGGADLNITGNNFVNCGQAAMLLAYAKRGNISGNSISHPAGAHEVPIVLFAVGSNGTEWQAFDNKVDGNNISYSGPNFAIIEQNVAIGTDNPFTGCTNTIFNNHITGSCYGEFLRDSHSSSVVGAIFSSNDATLGTGTSQSLTAMTRVGSGPTGALQFYSYTGTASPGYVAQIGDVGPGINVGGASGKGYMATGTRVTFGTLNDFAFAGKVVADNFYVVGAAAYSDSEANSLAGTLGLMKYVLGTGTASATGNIQISTMTQSGTRVWQNLTFGSNTAAGSNTQVIFNDSGAFGADAKLTFSKASGLVTMSATSTAIAGLVLATGFIQTANGLLAQGSQGNDIQAPVGGLYTKWVTYDNALYPKALATSTLLTTPNLGYGGFGYQGGSVFYYYNGTNWNTVDFSTVGGTPPGSNTWLVFNDSGSYGASAKATFNKTSGLFTVTGTAATAAIAVATGFIQSAEGFLSTNTSFQTINVGSGGVYALQVLATRTDGDATHNHFSLFAPTHNYGLSINSGGALLFNDVTSSISRLKLSTSGIFAVNDFVSGRTERLQFSDSDGTICVQGTSSTSYSGINMFDNAGLAASFQYGGSASSFPDQFFIAARKSTGVLVFSTNGLTERMRIRANGEVVATSGQITLAPGTFINATNGAMYYDSSLQQFRLFQNGAWIGVGGVGVTSLNSLTGAVNIVGGTGVTVTPSSPNISIAIGQPVGTTANVQFQTLVTSDAIQSNRTTGPAIYAPNAYILGKGLASSGLSSSQSIQSTSGITAGTDAAGGYYVGFTRIVDSSANASFASVTSSGPVVASIYDVAGGFFGQDATSGIDLARNGGGSVKLFLKGGIVYAIV